MNVITFKEKACERISRYFDSYLDSELLVETNHEILQHLASCPECTSVLGARARLKEAVKAAVAGQEAPAALRHSIRNTVRAGGHHGFFVFDLGRNMFEVTVPV